jgi:hypothetical protein
MAFIDNLVKVPNPTNGVTIPFEINEKINSTVGNSGFEQRGHLSFKKSSSCYEVRVDFDTLKL